MFKCVSHASLVALLLNVPVISFADEHPAYKEIYKIMSAGSNAFGGTKNNGAEMWFGVSVSNVETMLMTRTQKAGDSPECSIQIGSGDDRKILSDLGCDGSIDETDDNIINLFEINPAETQPIQPSQDVVDLDKYLEKMVSVARVSVAVSEDIHYSNPEGHLLSDPVLSKQRSLVARAGEMVLKYDKQPNSDFIHFVTFSGRGTDKFVKLSFGIEEPRGLNTRPTCYMYRTDHLDSKKEKTWLDEDCDGYFEAFAFVGKEYSYGPGTSGDGRSIGSGSNYNFIAENQPRLLGDFIKLAEALDLM